MTGEEKELMERLELVAVPEEMAVLVAEMSDEQVRDELRRLGEVLVSGEDPEEGKDYLYALMREQKHRNDALRERLDAENEEVAKLRAEVEARQAETRKSEEKVAALSEFKAELEARVGVLERYDKVGRNDPCPCGSGKKYKHCCGK